MVRDQSTHPPVLVLPYLVVSALVLVIFAVYGCVSTFDFINFLDDDLYIAGNPHIQNGLTFAGFKWAFLADLVYNSRFADYWQPVTFISRMIDVQLYGSNAGGHHLTNLLIHILNAVMLFFLFLKMTGNSWRSAFLSFVFALHPIQVEAVAWITARKDLLSAFFAIITLLTYVYTLDKPSKRKNLVLAIFFALGLMSKPNLVLFPLVLVLVDFWPLKQLPFEFSKDAILAWRKKVSEKWFLFLISLIYLFIFKFASSGVVVGVSKHLRILSASGGYIFYLAKAIFPVHLALYAAPRVENGVFLRLLGIVILIGALVFLALRFTKKYPYVLVGLLWFLIMLVPGVFIPPSDRFMYLPIVGLALLASWGISGFFQTRNSKMILTCLAFLTSIVLAASSFVQVGYWKNSTSLFKHALSVDANNEQAYDSLGNLMLEEGKIDEALGYFSKGLEIQPTNVDLHNNLGVALLRKNKVDEAAAQFSKALELMPTSAETHHNLGIVLEKQGKTNEAVQHYLQATQIEPDFIMAYNKLGVIMAVNGKFDEAKKYFSQSLQINPKDSCALYNLKAVLKDEAQSVGTINKL